MIVTPVRTRVFAEGEDLEAFITEHVPRIADGSILVVTSKIAALAEGRTAVARNAREKEALIKSESDFAMKTKYVWLTIRDNLVMASAGIDESNGNGRLILLPKDSYVVAARLRRNLMKKHGLRRLGVILTDSRLFPMRNGTVGVALGYAGFRGLLPYVGKKDIFGKPFRFQRVDVADSIATAAVLVMGEGDEQRPLAVVSGAPVRFVDRIRRHELDINIREDVYQPLFQRIRKVRFGKLKSRG